VRRALQPQTRPSRGGFRKSGKLASKSGGDPTVLVGGYVALVDAAPFLACEQKGFFAKHGVQVTLRHEIGWITVRDRLVSGELDFAHAPAGLVGAVTLGVGCAATPCVGLIEVNRHGNAITLSNEGGLYGTRGGLGEWAEAIGRKLVFAVPSWVSSHAWIAARWLREVGLEIAKHVQLVVVPPTQMVANLAAGHLDGFCVGEPWNSLAVRQKKGWVAACSRDIAPGHCEKVLMVTRERLERDPEIFVRLSSALSESCRYCEEAGNREEIAGFLAQTFGAKFDRELVRKSLIGPFADGDARHKTGRFHWFTGSWMDLEAQRVAAEVELQSRSWTALESAPSARRLQLLESCFSPGLRDHTQFI
jgi:ABC-type nitrate/sulfonate/bicarbonate transport system substrate-binding protein